MKRRDLLKSIPLAAVAVAAKPVPSCDHAEREPVFRKAVSLGSCPDVAFHPLRTVRRGPISKYRVCEKCQKLVAFNGMAWETYEHGVTVELIDGDGKKKFV